MSTPASWRGPWHRTAPRCRRVHSGHPRVPPRVPALLAAASVTVTLAACGLADPGSADVAVLADRADRLAEHLEAGEGCRAEREGDDLVARTRDAVAADRLSQEAADEIVAVIDEVTAAVPCEEAAVTEEEREAAEEAPEETPEEGPEEAPGSSEEEPEEGSGRGNNGNGPPGRSEEGPPGQRGNNAGRGRG